MSVPKRTAAILATGVALAGGSLAVITSANATDTSTSKAPGDRAGQRQQQHQDRTAALAKALGVSQDKLDAALKGLRQDRPDRSDARDAQLTSLAKAIGVTGDQLQSALRELRGSGDGPRPWGGKGPGRATPPTDAQRQAARDAFAKQLADKLGVDVTKVTSALTAQQQARSDARTAGQTQFATALAKALGLDVAQVQKALTTVGPRDHGRGDHRGFGGRHQGDHPGGRQHPGDGGPGRGAPPAGGDQPPAGG